MNKTNILKLSSEVIANSHHESLIYKINDHSLRMIISTNSLCKWQYSSNSAIFVFVIIGELEVQFACGHAKKIKESESITIPKAEVYRMFIKQRTVHLCFHKTNIQSSLIETPEKSYNCTPGCNLHKHSYKNWFEVNSEIFFDKSIWRINDHYIRFSIISGKPPMHYHPNADTAFIITQNSVLIKNQLHSFELNKMEVLFVPKEINHQLFTNTRAGLIILEPNYCETNIIHI